MTDTSVFMVECLNVCCRAYGFTVTVSQIYQRGDQTNWLGNEMDQSKVADHMFKYLNTTHLSVNPLRQKKEAPSFGPEGTGSAN